MRSYFCCKEVRGGMLSPVHPYAKMGGAGDGRKKVDLVTWKMEFLQLKFPSVVSNS